MRLRLVYSSICIIIIVVTFIFVSLKNIPQIQKGLGEEVGNNLSKMERGKETIVTLR